MRGSLIALSILVASAGPAFATANFGCQTKDKNIASLNLEGLTARDGTRLENFRGTIALQSGKEIEFVKADVKKFIWKKTLRLSIYKRLSRSAFIDLEIRTRAGDGTSLPGEYNLRTERRRATGKVSCEGG